KHSGRAVMTEPSKEALDAARCVMGRMDAFPLFYKQIAEALDAFAAAAVEREQAKWSGDHTRIHYEARLDALEEAAEVAECGPYDDPDAAFEIARQIRALKATT